MLYIEEIEINMSFIRSVIRHVSQIKIFLIVILKPEKIQAKDT